MKPMFKAPPLRHIAPFAGVIFGLSVAITLYKFLPHYSDAMAVIRMAITVALLNTAVPCVALWLSLGFSHREPIGSQTAWFGVSCFFLSLIALSFLGSVVSLCLFVLLPVLYGAMCAQARNVPQPQDSSSESG